MFSRKVILVLNICMFYFVECIVYRGSTKHSQRPFFHPKPENYRWNPMTMHSDSPLWILSDRRVAMNQPTTYRTTTSPRPLNSNRIFTPKLPNHYTNLTPGTNGAMKKSSKYQNVNIPRRPSPNNRYEGLPVFDEDSDDFSPVIIYRGLKAKMIYNTIMSDKRYPMHEPVPGQIMYPPTQPKFKSIPVDRNQQLTSTNTTVFPNISTMIPFYAHEAMLPWKSNFIPMINTRAPLRTPLRSPLKQNNFRKQQRKPQEWSGIKTSPLPSIVYGMTYPVHRRPNPQKPIAKPYQTYQAYRSKDEVHIKPVYEKILNDFPPKVVSSFSQTATNLSSQIRPPANHQIKATTPTFLNHNLIDSTNNTNANNKFQIVYDDLQDPYTDTKPKLNIHSAKYAGFKSSFSLPIYTLNKLLQETEKIMTQKNKTALHKFDDMDTSASEGFALNVLEKPLNETYYDKVPVIKPKPKPPFEVDPNYTWFVMNSRYRRVNGKHSSTYFNPLSKDPELKVEASKTSFKSKHLSTNIN